MSVTNFKLVTVMFFTFTFMYLGVGCAFNGVCGEVRGQLAGVSSLLPPCEPQDSNPGHQACRLTGPHRVLNSKVAGAGGPEWRATWGTAALRGVEQFRECKGES